PFVESESDFEQCNTQEGVLSIQKSCGKHQEQINEADERHDDQGMCRHDDQEMYRHLFNGLRCVADKVPNCFSLYFRVMGHYIHSPHKCELTETQILELQRLVAGPREEEEEKVSTSPSPPIPQKSSDNGRMLEEDADESPSIHDKNDTIDREEEIVEGSLTTYLEPDNNDTVLFENGGDYNSTSKSPAGSDKNGEVVVLAWTLSTATCLATVAVLLPWTLAS
ncbi:hypothetical protein ElyMa_000050200, partial [Elysia marginata]